MTMSASQTETRLAPFTPLRRFPIRTAPWLIALFFLLPAGLMAMGFCVADETSRQVGWWIWLTAMCSLPWIVWRAGHRPWAELRRVIGLTKTHLLHGLWTGAVAAGVICGVYVLFFRGRMDATAVVDGVQRRGHMAWYWPWAMGLSLLHSLFEEFYWRGFLQGELALWIKKPSLLILLMAGLFGLHHVVALADMLDVGRIALCVVLTMVGSAAWTVMRLRGLSLWDCWLSHAMADLAIAWIAWDLIS